MSEQTGRDDLMGYAKRHLLSHMRDAGMNEQEIEAYIAEMPAGHPLREHFASQFVESLSPEQREAAARRLRPVFSGPTIRITVLTVPEQPRFEVSAAYHAWQVDGFVRAAYGVQENGQPHNWRGDPVQTNV